MIHEKLASGIFRMVDGGRHKPRRRPSFKPQHMLLEDRRLPAAIVPIPASNPRVALSTIFWNGEAQPLNPTGLPNVPSPASVGAAKTIKITNNSPSIIYPFLRGQNGGVDPNASPVAPYDPQDVVDHEFRQYIGYSGPAGRQFLGLPSGASITVQVPLALWDGDNLYLATDGDDLTSANIFGYDRTASITVATTAPVSGTTWITASNNYPAGFKPLVMFYFSNKAPVTLPNDAPAQLTEVTFRDPYLKTFINDPDQTFPLVNYDVSYVNNMVAPVSMAAGNVPITYQTNPLPNPPTFFGYKDYGWLATNRNTATFGKAITDFTSNSGQASLGQYFNGQGWPQYYNPDPTIDVIPSGANLFADSPLNVGAGLVHTSSYDPNRWLLSSAGNAPIQAGGAGVGQQGFVYPRATNRIYMNNPTPRFVSDLKQMLAQGAVYVSYPGDPTRLAQVGSFQPNPNGTPYVALLSAIPTSGASGKVYAFTRTASDYAVKAITDLWYSWAQYHVQQNAGFAPASAPANLNYTADGYVTNQITLTGDVPAGLVLGMTVTAPVGIPTGTTILKIDGSDIYLSQIPAAGAPASQSFTFSKPELFNYDPAYTQPYTLTFDDDATPNAKLFAASVYEAMAAEAGVDPLPASYLPYSMNLVSQVIQFYAKLPGYDRPGDTGSSLVGQVRDVVKSVLRGVYDYLQVPDQSLWYPNPALKPDGLLSNQNFNVFNLDPYVWFVHDVQKMSAYGFSVDDDVSNPTATGPLLDADGKPNHAPSKLQIGFGGTGGLGNPNQWFPTIPWGAIQTSASLGFLDDPTNPYNGYPIIKLLGPDAHMYYNMINNPGTGQVGAMVTAPGFLSLPAQLVHKGPVTGTDTVIVLKLPKGGTLTPTDSTPVTISAQS